MKLIVISGQKFGMVPQRSKIHFIISVAGHQVIRNLSEPSDGVRHDASGHQRGLSETSRAKHRIEGLFTTSMLSEVCQAISE